MYNRKASENQKMIKIIYNGQPTLVPESKISAFIKKRLKDCKSIRNLFQDFEVDISRIDDLHIEITELDGKYAETDMHVMKLNKFMFADGDFFEKYMFVPAHEIVHWLSRIKENDAYFNDPEEVLGFVSSIAFEIDNGSDFDIIWNKIYPKISFHFNDELKAREFFKNMCMKAKKLSHRG